MLIGLYVYTVDKKRFWLQYMYNLNKSENDETEKYKKSDKYDGKAVAYKSNY